MHCAYLALQVRVAVLAWKAKKKNGLLYRHLLGIDRLWNKCIFVLEVQHHFPKNFQRDRSVWSPLMEKSCPGKYFFFPWPFSTFMCQCRRHPAAVIASGSIALETCFPRFKILNFILYYILTLQFLLFYFALCIVLDVAALQFVGRSISVFLTFNILLCTKRL